MNPGSSTAGRTSRRGKRLAIALVVAAVAAGVTWGYRVYRVDARRESGSLLNATDLNFQPRQPIDTGGFSQTLDSVPSWGRHATLSEISAAWDRIGFRLIERMDQHLAGGKLSGELVIRLLMDKAALLNSEGKADEAYVVLEEARARAGQDVEFAVAHLYSIIYFQGVVAVRRGENDNCILCRGESSCILPIAKSAQHTNPAGSTLAIRHFTEYLSRFPDDLQVRWLLNVAHMTLGQHPDKVDPRFVIPLDHFRNSEFDIGKFRDVGHLVGLNKFNQAGGAILDDFDNDGLLDAVVTTMDPTQSMSIYRNMGDGHFEDRTQQAGLTGQLGGLNCVQADYNNDGRMDIYIPRGAWLTSPIRPTLLRNDGEFQFTDVTEQAGLLDPVNSNSATWADYDNDGLLDLFVCCEAQSCRLYHNLGNGTFEEVSTSAGLGASVHEFCKGAAWIDFDNDDHPDLFLNHLSGTAQLFHNRRDGTFVEVSQSQGIHGEITGFSCWAWDYNNDGWLDLFATCYERNLAEVVNGLQEKPHGCRSNRLYRNRQGKGFEDVTRESGLDLVFGAMGSNFGDFDNDGWLDMYLGTGDPKLDMLIPNRMFRNVGGQRFAEITGSSGTGQLQKGHGVACGDWDRDGDVDVFIQMGGAINGDRYHNILFQNPGQGHHSLTVKLIGSKSNRAAIGARIKVVTPGAGPGTLHRHVSSGSSFGANPLEQTIGLGAAERVELLEIHWPTSGTTQTFHDIPADQCIEISEFAESYKTLPRQPIALPKDRPGMGGDKVREAAVRAMVPVR